jgi:hypothetical protein
VLDITPSGQATRTTKRVKNTLAEEIQKIKAHQGIEPKHSI